MQINVFAMDLAKNKFQVHGYDAHGEVRVVKTLQRAKVLAFFEAQPVRCEIVMEACGGAHYWARQLQALGYRVRLIPAQFVQPFVVGDKTDAHDTDAIYEASRRPKIRPVPVKSIAQQDALLAHSTREQWIKTRTALVNQIRGELAERGVVFGRGHRPLREGLRALLADQPHGDITGVFLAWLAERLRDWRELDERIADCDKAMAAHYRHSPAATLIGEVPGIGLLTATATVAMVGEAQTFRSARQFAAWLGLPPKERSSGEYRRQGGLTKRGDTYLRKLYVHGGRAVVNAALRRQKAGRPLTQREQWIVDLVQRRHFNKAVVAVANKNARIVWAMLTSGETYRQPLARAA